MGKRLEYNVYEAEKEVEELVQLLYKGLADFTGFSLEEVKDLTSEVETLIGTAIKEFALNHEDAIALLEKTVDEYKDTGLQLEYNFIDSKNSFFENTCLHVSRMTIRIKRGDGEWLTGPVMRSTLLLKRMEKLNPVTKNHWHFWHTHTSFGEKGTEGGETYSHEELKKKNQLLEEELDRRKNDLRKSLEELKAAQEQLVQQEKLASLGQLTAGIAHEIKNPLNFVNNFSDLSVELVEEARKELSDFSRQTSGNGEQVSEMSDLLDDIEANLNKINEHGSRADGIVKSMLQHSRGGDGEMEPTDLNELIKEYVNLSFHGMRASEDPINVDIEMDLDDDLGEVPLIAEDFSRVIINLCNNAFDAMRKKQEAVGGKPSSAKASEGINYEPKLTVRTSRNIGKVTVEIEDNGPGIPEEMREKVLQPFFTTKKGKEGTGLGLSITNDIVKAHGGEIQVTSQQNKYTCFRISLNK